ncbi:molybdopterin molybdochelatase [Marinobacterium halophilum]|uniref:Molybdopterin molybdenumtransferase n=1 Tax=Marinobacterium halophilum TaxID=267374 RepID=A0A2P8ERK3_9GAMM|nr:gephyrin-like molybdotransferase Glp [Marinobacterium halophilum]PSL12065.1 molybdopterin molybdochelatase [Marinobacterium halophilum]
MTNPYQDPCSQPGLIPLEQARQHLLDQAHCRVEPERCALLDANSRVLAADHVARIDVPPSDNSAMDGYAVRYADTAADVPTEMEVSQRIPAGTAPAALKANTAARIFTGAPIPPGADAVVMQEQVSVAGSRVVLPASIKPGQNIRPRGQDIANGETLLAAGARLDPLSIGVLASVGAESVSVYRPLRVGVMSTGDELAEPGTPLQPGQIYNSNRYLLLTLIRQLGMEPVDLGTTPDEPDATRAALQHAAETADVILTTGGVSVGEEDHVKDAIEALGHLDMWRLNLKPGKPFAAGHVQSIPFYGLPGNPGAVIVTFALLVRPCLLKAQGATDFGVKTRKVRAGFNRSRTNTREEYLRVSPGTNDDVLLSENQSSGVLSVFMRTEGLLRVPANTAIRQGDLLEFIDFKDVLY